MQQRGTLGRRLFRFSGGRAVVLFMVADLGAVVLTAALGYGVARRTATAEAIRDARELTEAQARSVAPLLTDAVVAGDPASLRALDDAVHDRVLSGRVVRVKVWSAAGRVAYSDDAALIGRRFALSDEEAQALRTGRADAELSDLAQPENTDERTYKKLLEVYVPTTTPTGEPLLFEVYHRFDAVAANGRRVLGAFAPALVVGLVALWLAQLPLALALSRRLQAGHTRQRELLARAIESSEQERRRIAADLHDSVVQGLAGSSMSLSALAVEARRRAEPDLAAGLADQAAALRQWVRELRTLVVSIAPPRLHEEGLAAALADLTSAVTARGVAADIDIPESLHLSRTAEALVFRGAQEALRNVVAHAHASHVHLAVSNGTPVVRLTVDDDGVGFDPAGLTARAADGHVGLRLLGELAADADGRLDLESEPGRGTRLVLEVPAR